jgi:hypothetical protein
MAPKLAPTAVSVEVLLVCNLSGLKKLVEDDLGGDVYMDEDEYEYEVVRETDAYASDPAGNSEVNFQGSSLDLFLPKIGNGMEWSELKAHGSQLSVNMQTYESLSSGR